MTNLNMISFNDPGSLSKIFNQLSEGPGKILVWQSFNEGQRVCKEAKLGLLNLVQDEITFYPTEGEFNFNNRSYLYFLSSRRNTIFKASILYHSRLKLIIRLPQQVMISNTREEGRHEFTMDDRFIHYTHNSKHHPNHYQLYLSSKLLDASAHGLAFKSSVNNIVNYRKGDRLWIRSPFDGGELLEGEVCYVTMISAFKTRQNHLRVGVKF